MGGSGSNGVFHPFLGGMRQCFFYVSFSRLYQGGNGKQTNVIILAMFVSLRLVCLTFKAVQVS